MEYKTFAKSKIEVGDRFMIKWRNGQYFPAEIIEYRQSKRRESTFDSNFQSSDYEFYVHYVNFDRRLDEWVSRDRINLESCLQELNDDTEGSRKGIKRALESDDISRDEKELTLSVLEKENEEITKMKNIQSIVLGSYEIETWYFSPFPEDYCDEERLYICEFCLKYMKKQRTFINHCHKCEMNSPPGKLIYSDESLSMFEVDGKENKLYCQNLCLLSKLFLDHKTLYYDVDPFMFYVLCERGENHHIVGYFSKEKISQDGYNLACILTFPPFQRKGYGKFLISVSYELSKREGVVGSPEKPLSDLGKISYRSYWAFVILSLFQDRDSVREISIEKISRATGIRSEDILSTLHSLNMIRYWKGQHVVAVNQNVVESILSAGKQLRLCNTCCLTWQPQEKTVKKH
jgi:histone acetyltransferase MYST1